MGHNSPNKKPGVKLNTLDNESFCSIWNEYNSKWKLPSLTTLQNYVPYMHIVDDRTDSYIVNIILRPLEPLKQSFLFLRASRRLEKCTNEAIANVVPNTFKMVSQPHVVDAVLLEKSVVTILWLMFKRYIHLVAEIESNIF